MYSVEIFEFNFYIIWQYATLKNFTNIGGV